jgi:hypothetical protein
MVVVVVVVVMMMMMMMTARHSETSVNIRPATLHHIPEDGDLFTRINDLQ